MLRKARLREGRRRSESKEDKKVWVPPGLSMRENIMSSLNKLNRRVRYQASMASRKSDEMLGKLNHCQSGVHADLHLGMSMSPVKKMSVSPDE
jgi:hypothetical protein